MPTFQVATLRPAPSIAGGGCLLAFGSTLKIMEEIMSTTKSNSKNDCLQPIENLVQTNEGNVFTTSLIIAEAFDKGHKDVLKAISNLECSPEFRERNFAPTFRDVPGPNGAVRQEPAFNITRDGFAFLAMGFTGKKAAAWKEKFLEAFNAMERALTQRRPVFDFDFPQIAAGDTRDEKCVRMVRGFCAYWALVDKTSLPVAELSVCTHLGINRLDELTSENFKAAMDYLLKSCYHPTFGRFDKMASEDKVVLLGHMLTACAQFRHSENDNFKDYFEHLTGTKLEDMLTLTDHDAEKMLHAAGCLLHRAFQHTVTTSIYSEV